MNKIVLNAKAKINLTLDVVGKREDGYHELEMIMQTINLQDTVILEKLEEPRITIKNNYRWLLQDERNIAYKAAQIFFEYTGLQKGIAIQVIKRIPVGAGLAGGSTDAAAVLIGMNRLFQTGLKKKELMELSLKIGTDIPFCILRGTAIARGVGEKLTQLPTLPQTYVVLAKPPVSISTVKVYKSLEWEKISKHPNTPEMIQAIKDKDLNYVAKNMVNVLEEVTIPMCPIIEDIKRELILKGAEGAMMSGSGSCVFGLFKDKRTAYQAGKYLKYVKGLKEVYVTNTYFRK